MKRTKRKAVTLQTALIRLIHDFGKFQNNIQARKGQLTAMLTLGWITYH